MFATLEMLKMFDACGAGYGRVVRAVGGINYGMTKPIPLWVGATTSAGLSDVDWIVERGIVIEPETYDKFFAAARPLLIDYAQGMARRKYAEQFLKIRAQMGKGRKNGLNTMGLKILAVMDACVNLRTVSPEDFDMIVRFMKPAAFASYNYEGFREIRKIVLAAANEAKPEDVIDVVTSACMFVIKDPNDLDRPWRELLLEKYDLHQGNTRKKVDEDDDEDDEDEPVRPMKRGACKKPVAKTAQKSKEPETEDQRVEQACYLFNCSQSFTRRFGMDSVSNTDKLAVRRFMTLFDQGDFFANLPVTGERPWNGQHLPNDLNLRNSVDVLVNRDADGKFVNGVFAINDPVVARQVARFVRAAGLNVEKNILTVGVENAKGVVELVNRETRESGLEGSQDDDDEDEDEGIEEDEDEDDDVVESPTSPATATINLSVRDLFRSEEEITRVYVTNATSTPATPTVTVTTTDTEPSFAKTRGRRSRVVS